MTDQTVMTILIAILTALMGWVGFSITAVLRGWMVPRSTHLLQVEILEKRVLEKAEESREWRAAYQAEQAIGQEIRAQNRMLLEQGQTSVHALEGIRSSLIQVARKDVGT